MSALNWDWFEYRIGSHYLSALINDDESGLEDNEAREFSEWCAAQSENAQAQGFTVGHWTDIENTENFARCDVTGLLGDVVTVRLYVHKQGAQSAAGGNNEA